MSRTILLALFIISALSACADTSGNREDTKLPTKSEPTSTSNPTPTFTIEPSPTPAQIPRQLINFDSVERIEELGVYGPGRIESISISPLGDLVAFGGNRGIWLYQIQTKELNLFFRSIDLIRGVDWSPDGQKLVAVDLQGSIRIINVSTGNVVQTYKLEDDLRGVSWSPDGNYIGVYRYEDQSLYLLNAGTGEVVDKFKSSGSFSWSPDSQSLVFKDGLSINIYDIKLGAITLSWEDESIFINPTVAWSPDGRLIATVAIDGNIKIWDVNTGQLSFELGRKIAYINFVWSPDGQFLAVTDWSSEIQIWEVEREEIIKTLSYPNIPALFIDWSSGGEYIVTTDIGFASALWDVDSGLVLDVIHPGKDTIYNISWSPDELYLAMDGFNGVIHLWNLNTMEEDQTLSWPEGKVIKAVWSPDSQLIVAHEAGRFTPIGFEGASRLIVWETETWNVYNTRMNREGWQNVSWVDNFRIAVWSGYGAPLTMSIWGIDGGQPDYIIGGIEDPYFIVEPSPDFHYMVATDEGNQVEIYDLKTGELVLTFDWVGFQWSPSGRYLAISSEEYAIKIIDFNEDIHSEDSVFTHGKGGSDPLMWSPDERYILVKEYDGPFLVFDWKLKQKVFSIEVGDDFHWLANGDLAFINSENGNGGDSLLRGERELCILNVNKGGEEQCKLIDVDASEIIWSPGDRYIAFLGYSGEIYIWGIP